MMFMNSATKRNNSAKSNLLHGACQEFSGGTDMSEAL